MGCIPTRADEEQNNFSARIVGRVSAILNSNNVTRDTSDYR